MKHISKWPNKLYTELATYYYNLLFFKSNVIFLIEHFQKFKLNLISKITEYPKKEIEIICIESGKIL